MTDQSRLSVQPLLHAFDHYAQQWPAEAELAYAFAQFARVTPDAFVRSNLQAHFTGSAWLVSADGARVLLLHHRKLDRWLQPGGHADGDPDLQRVALREAQEETGLVQLCMEQAIFDLDRHRIPARGSEPEHWHHDVRYVARAAGDEHFVRNGESRALAWRAVADVAADVTLEGSLRRMARKWLARGA